MSIKQNFTQSPSIRLMINIGALMDIPTGSYLKGRHGENILLGGLGSLTGITGIANSFKSLILHYMMLSAADRITSTTETSMSTYDTEVNMHEGRLKMFASKFLSFMHRDIIDEGTWVVTDKTIYAGNKWYAELKKYLESKLKDADKLTCTLPFFDRDHKTQLQIITPTFVEVDSLSHFATEDVMKMQDENELGDSGGNTVHMRLGLAKTRLMMELPALTAAANHFTLITAHMGKEIAMGTGPFAPAPTKQLQHMKIGDKVKGVTGQFIYLMSNFWQTTHVGLLINQSTKGPEYPRNAEDSVAGDIDLNIVTLKLLRSKSGASGLPIELIVSQEEGLLPSLTEFHYIKGMDRYGLSGSTHNYVLDLLPDVKLSRTTIRSKIDEVPLLARALNITSELCQINSCYRYMSDIYMTPKELYDDLKAQGYDMNLLLTTRGWFTVNDESHPVPRLSTKDLLCMTTKCKQVRPDEAYFPYWMDENKQIRAKNERKIHSF